MDTARIQIDPAVMLGKPVVRGTRITVEQLLRDCAAGQSVEQVAQLYENLAVDDVRSALGFAAGSAGAGRSWVARTTPAAPTAAAVTAGTTSPAGRATGR